MTNKIKITRFHEHKSGPLHGFVDVSVPMWGTLLNIKGCKVFIQGGTTRVALPSREYLGDTGEIKYASIIGIDDEHIYKRFTAGLLEAWDRWCLEQQKMMPTVSSADEMVPF